MSTYNMTKPALPPADTTNRQMTHLLKTMNPYEAQARRMPRKPFVYSNLALAA